MENFWDFNVWGLLNLFSILLISMLFANFIKKSVKFLKNSLIPTSVLGGILLLIVAIVYEKITGIPLFNTQFFGGNGGVYDDTKISTLEIITYHSLALGFIASALKPSKRKFTKERNVEIFNTGITTVSSYLLQGILGLGISIIFALVATGFFKGAGVILCFGYGQGTGQALNWGGIYQNDYGFVGGRSFGLTIAALGFLSASIGGVIHLNILKKKGLFEKKDLAVKNLYLNDIQNENEIELNGGMDKFSVQMALILITYTLTYLFMLLIGSFAGGLETTIFGFNFLFGVLMASLVKVIINFLTKKKIMHIIKSMKKYLEDALIGIQSHNFLMEYMIQELVIIMVE